MEKLNQLRQQLSNSLKTESDFIYNDKLYALIYDLTDQIIEEACITQQEYDNHLSSREELQQELVSRFWIRIRTTGLSRVKGKARTKKVREYLANRQRTDAGRSYSILKWYLGRWRSYKLSGGILASPILEISDPSEFYELIKRNYIRESTTLEYREAIRKMSNIGEIIECTCKDRIIHEEGTTEYEDTMLSVYWSLIHEDVALIGTADYSHVRYLSKSIDYKIKQYIKEIAYCKDNYEEQYILAQIQRNEVDPVW